MINMAQGRDMFDSRDVIKDLKYKIIRRHPHVFGGKIAKTSQDAVESFKKAKCKEKREMKGKKEKVVLVSGVFDILHPGHVFFLEKARQLGDKLVVIVARDSVVEKEKRRPVIEQKQRLEVIRSLKTVDLAFLGSETDIFKPVLKIKPDIISLGANQEIDENWLKKCLKERGIDSEVVRINQLWQGDLNSTKKIIRKISDNFDKGNLYSKFLV